MPCLGDAVPTIGASAASIKFHETKRLTPLPPRRGAAVAGSSGNVTCPQGNWTATIMTSDASLELSLEQLISALDKKLFGECARIRSTLLPTPRTLVAAFTAEVRLQELNSGNPQILTWYFAGRYPGEKSQRGSTTSQFFEELDTTCEPSSSRGHLILRRFRLQCGSTANRTLDPRLSILARIYQF